MVDEKKEEKPRTVDDVKQDLEMIESEIVLCKQAGEQSSYQAALSAWRLNALQAARLELNREMLSLSEATK